MSNRSDINAEHDQLAAAEARLRVAEPSIPSAAARMQVARGRSMMRAAGHYLSAALHVQAKDDSDPLDRPAGESVA